MTGLDGERQAALAGQELGAWLRQQREDRFWSRAEMARQLIAAGHALGDTSVPAADHVAHNIYRWERGTSNPSEQYRIYYCKALGIPRDAFGVPGHPGSPGGPPGPVVPGVRAEAVLSFLAGVTGLWQEIMCQPDGEPPLGPDQPLSALSPDRALDTLHLAWGDAYGIGHGSGQWQATRRDGTGHVLTGRTPDKLNTAIRAD